MNKKHVSNRIFSIVVVVTLAVYVIYLWLWVNPSLYLIKEYREFFTDTGFLKEFIDFPGEPVIYLSRLFIQFFNYPFVSSLMIFFCLIAVYFLLVKTLKREKNDCLISFIPVFILLLMHNDYGHSIGFDIHILFLCAALFFFTVSLVYHRAFMYLCFSFLLAIILYLNGLLTALTFTVTAMIILGLKKKTALSILWTTIVSFTVFILFYVFFSLSFRDLKQEFDDIIRIYSFRYYPLLLFTSVAILPLLNVFVPASYKMSIKKAIGTGLFTPAVFFILYFTSDKEERQNLQVQHYARNEDWETTLKIARNCEYPDKNTVYYTNLALYHTGKMCDELFFYNQSFGSEGLLLAEMGAYSEIVPNQEIFLQLGALSLSIIWGTEATNVYGYNPYVLRLLTKAYLAGGYIREANKILNLSERTIFREEWVKKYRAIANDTSLMRLDPELNRLYHAKTPLAVVSKQSPLTNLYLLSRDSNLNKMAYDYMLVGTLLDHQIENFTFCISRLKEFGYEKIPKLYMEGLVYSALYSSSLPLDVRDFKYDESIILRFYAFQSELIMLQHKPLEAKEILKTKFGDTYWYYLIFESQLNDSERMNIFNQMAS